MDGSFFLGPSSKLLSCGMALRRGDRGLLPLACGEDGLELTVWHAPFEELPCTPWWNPKSSQLIVFHPSLVEYKPPLSQGSQRVHKRPQNGWVFDVCVAPTIF